MIRRSPSELYIKYLLVHPNGYTDEQVIQALQFAKFDYLGAWYLKKLRTEMPLPVPFYPNDIKHRHSQKFLLEQGLQDLFHPDQEVKDAFKLLKFPRCKHWIEVMLTCFVPPVEISRQLIRAMNFSVGAKTIERYSSIFYNPNLLDVDEMRALVEFRHQQLADHPDPEIRAQARAAKIAFRQSGLKTAADYPMSALTSYMAMIEMGLTPTNIDPYKLLKMATQQVSFRIAQAAYDKDAGAASRLNFWATGLRQIDEILRENVDAEEQMREQLANLHIKHDQLSMPTVHQITQGNVTVNMEPEAQDERVSTGDRDRGEEGEGSSDE